MEYTFYKIQVGNECYVGSTKNFKNRMSEHKYNCRNEKKRIYNIKVYKSIREVGWDKIDVMIIDKIIYNSKHEAFDMETKYMNMFDAKLNSRYPKRSMKEYYEANKERIAERDRKKYRESNQEMIRERGKKYYQANKEEIAEKKKQYYEANKEKMKEKIPCQICDKMLRKDCMKKHIKKIH